MFFNKYKNSVYTNTNINDFDFFEKEVFNKNKVIFFFKFNKNIVHSILLLLITQITINPLSPIYFKGSLKYFLFQDTKILNFLSKSSILNLYIN